MIRLSPLVALLALLAMLSSPLSAGPEDPPSFVLGFKTLAELIPDVAGEPLENEHHNLLNGDGLQMTSTGLMVWRKADNWTAFTDGWRSWVNGPLGLQERLNSQRFDWELEVEEAGQEEPPADPADAATPGADPGTETPAATPNPSDGAALSPTPAGSAPFIPTPAPTTEPSALPTSTSAPTALPTATSAPTATPVPSPTPIPGGVQSPDPCGEWVTSVHPTTRYYASRGSSYWQSWSAGNRIWFASEAALLAAYPGRTRADTPATATTVPTAVPTTVPTAVPTTAPTVAPTAASTSTPAPTQTAVPTATTAPAPSGGIRSPDPAGDWVTSVHTSTQYYTSRDRESVWQAWAASNRIWFATEAALLAAYPGRTRK